ncbi:MAG: hypothetical protein H6581_04840 [Bacteroidia bacterium]|nr:hypothetical protein [Bacteroidia bacterium]
MNHIGEEIRLRARNLRLGPTELAGKINTSKQNVYCIYKRDSLDTKLLKRISMALEFDFFEMLSVDLVGREKVEAAQKELYHLRLEVEQLQSEIAYLKKINELQGRLIGE